MTRIVAGFAGSLALAVPRRGTRPTSDRVREAIFSALEARDGIRGAVVLDLYAGSGALGLEAASRGAAAVTLVESNRRAAELCRENARSVQRAAPAGAAPRIEVVVSPVQAFLDHGAGQAACALVFADPPYDLPEDQLGRALRSLAPSLATGATVVVERNSRSPEPILPARLELERHRAYGDTALWWLHAS